MSPPSSKTSTVLLGSFFYTKVGLQRISKN